MSRLLDALLRRAARLIGFRWYVILVQPLTVSMGTHPTPDGLTVREATVEELDAIADQSELGTDRQFLEAAKERDDRCFAAFEADQIVAFTWRARTWAPHDDYRVVTEKPYVYGYKGMTLPRWRGHRLNAITNHSANATYQAEGFTHMITFTSLENRKSRNAMTEKSGYRVIGFIAYQPFAGRLLQYRSPAVRATGLRFTTQNQFDR